MPGRSHPPAKLQAETPLTPARSFRDEDLAVGLAGFEPATPGTQSQCASKLRYSPRLR